MNLAYLSLGSNIAKETSLPSAVALLAQQGTLTVVSTVYETAPVGRPRQPLFWNAAVLLETALTPERLKDGTLSVIEERLGRKRDPDDPNAPRTIDIDISLWNLDVLTVKGKPVPDPDILRYAHVAVPLAEIAPGLVHPVNGQTLAVIARRLLREGQSVRRRPEVVLREGG
jgi:2-amino-4-hydroxy-6-hydroxymethyldihydropteridine diphosphokinase